jgi:hypothetical protein
MKYLLVLSGLLFLSCSSPSCECATAENICTRSCKAAFKHLENDKTEVFGVPNNGSMPKELDCKCYTKTTTTSK